MSIVFIDINDSSEKGSPVEVINTVDLDQVMTEQSAAGCVVHGEHLVYIATFSTDICEEISAKAQSATGLSYCISDDAVDGIKLVANGDNMQADEEAVYTANFGLTCRPQRPTIDSTNPETKSVDALLGAPRGGRVICPAGVKHSLSSIVGYLYHSDFYPFFFADSIMKSDQWYGARPNGKRPRNPRFSRRGQNLDKRLQMKVHHPEMSSLPKVSDVKHCAAAEAECRFRSISEWIISNVFHVLPYGATPLLAMSNLKKATEIASQSGNNLPCSTLCRAFPKGATGLHRVKELHDDGNAAVIPGIWTSIIGDPDVCLRFIGRGMNHALSANTARFCWFYGWIPHKTEVTEAPQTRSKGAMHGIDRLHHSAFWKPEFEFLALELFAPPQVKDILKTYDDGSQK